VTPLDVVVFAGPTLPAARVAEVLPGACCLGPVQRGDVFRLMPHRPRVICIIDGLFGRTLPVWHKEILWALDQGVSVFGAASMGALRAVELAPFGMVGVGRIFEAYQREEIELEDEVTVMHAGPERDYRASSEALVDMRATLAAAEGAGVIDATTRAGLVALAASTFYAERSYAQLLAHADRSLLADDARAQLTSFLSSEQNRVKLKQADALECLGVIRAERDARTAGSGAARPGVDFEFAYTDAFDAFGREESELASVGPNTADAVPSHLLVEELQVLGPEVFEPLLRQATARALRVALAAGGSSKRSPSAVVDPLSSSAACDGSSSGVQLSRLLQELELSPESYRAWLQEEAQLRDVEEPTLELLQAQFAPLLRALGDYPRVAQRARRKLQLCPVFTPLPEPDVAETWSAYFGGLLNVDTPDDLDGYARSVGFGDQRELLVAVVRELEFRRRA
jgi:hypothetical protein